MRFARNTFTGDSEPMMVLRKIDRNIAMIHMGTSKTEAYRIDQIQLARWAQALAHPARIAILQHLIKLPGCVCGELVDTLPLAQATVSQHLNVLKRAGLIVGDIDGPRTCYCIDQAEWEQAKTCLIDFFTQTTVVQDNDCC